MGSCCLRLSLAVTACSLWLGAQSPDPILAGVPKDTTSLLVIRDPLPHLQALLRTPELADIAKATAGLQQDVLGMSLQPAQLERQLSLLVPMLPREIVVAASASTMMELSRAAIAALALFVAGQTGDEGAAESLRATAQRHLVALQLPSLSGWVQARDARVAEQWFEAVGEAFDGVADAGFVVTAKDDTLTVALQPARIRDGRLLQRLRSIGCDPTPLEALATTFSIELQQDRLRFRAGSLPDGPLPPAALGELWQPSPDQILFSQVELGAAAELWSECSEWCDEALTWADESAAPMLVQFGALVRRITEQGVRTAASMVVKDGVEWIVDESYADEEEGELQAPPPELLRCLDPQLGPYWLVNVPLDEALLGIVAATTEDLAMRASRPGRMEAFMKFTELGEGFVDFFASDVSAVFESGVAIVSGETRFEGVTIASTAVGELPCLSLAIVAPTKAVEDGNDFCGHLADLAAEFAEVADGVGWQDEDLGFGLPTRTLQWPPAKDLPLQVAGGFRLHHVQRGTLMILSTDPKLTRQLLTRIAADGAVAAPPNDLLSSQFASGAHLARLCDIGGRWIAAWAKSAPEQFPMADQAVAMLAVAAKGMALFDRYEDRLTFRKGGLRNQTRLVLKSPVERAALRKADGGK